MQLSKPLGYLLSFRINQCKGNTHALPREEERKHMFLDPVEGVSRMVKENYFSWPLSAKDLR
jgi:hypothetical protein